VIGHKRVRVLLVHNAYRQSGGEDEVFVTEARVLRERGHDVITYARQNPPEDGAALIKLAGQAFWNHRSYGELRALIRQTSPDVVHLHNTFPYISPAALYAARREGVATVQTLHNYRLICPNGLLFRAGRPCEDCVRKSVPWPGVVHACYRDSHAASLAAAATVSVHHGVGTWATQVDRYIALTEFARHKFIAGGLNADRIAVKSNVVYPDPGVSAGGGDYAVFVGRLSREKGIELLLDAWPRLSRAIQLVVVGDGPLAPVVKRAAAVNSGISWLGRQSREQVQELLGGATCLIVPSIWYETFGLVVAEAFARGTPVVAARLGALAELVDHNRTGLHFTAGDPDDLARQVSSVFDNSQRAAAMRQAARAEYERRYSVEANYPILCRIYADAIACRRGDG
jgi:glycosyltransferase involved in cell wall biosynthesis